MAECEGWHEDVKRITNYSKTGQWLCETCVANMEKPPERNRRPHRPAMRTRRYKNGRNLDGVRAGMRKVIVSSPLEQRFVELS